MEKRTRFEVRDGDGAVLWERRSQGRAVKCARAEARCGRGSYTVVRVEAAGNLHRERQVARYDGGAR